MGNITKEIVIGAIGSVVGALIVFLASYGFRFTKKTRKSLKEEFENDKRLYHDDFPGVRQNIQNEYLFSILKYLLLGNIAWVLPSVLMLFDVFTPFNSPSFYSWTQGLSGALGLIFFYIGLGKVLKFIKIKGNSW